jgi:hypothetical protein
VALVITVVSEESLVSIIGVKRSSELGNLAIFLRSVLQLLAIANVVPSSQILYTLMMEAILSYETSDLTRATRV